MNKCEVCGVEIEAGADLCLEHALKQGGVIRPTPGYREGYQVGYRNGHLEGLQDNGYSGPKDRRLADHVRQIHDLERKVKRQARELSRVQATLVDKNRLLDVLGMVWCDGGCEGGVFRYTQETLTEEMILRVERNTKRLRRWWNAYRFKQGEEGRLWREWRDWKAFRYQHTKKYKPS